jgi:spore coat polysaccharide biosynthesis predicted glycosyltransferase SpsG
VLRTLALAEAVVSGGGEAVLASASLDGPLGARWRRSGMATALGDVEPGSPADCSWLLGLARERRADWIVLHGNRFDAAYQARTKADGFRLLVVDDYGSLDRYDAHIVLNQNVFARETWYEQRAGDARLLLGPQYALLREEFSTAAREREVPLRADRLLVTLGASDPDNALDRVMDAVRSMPGSGLVVRIVAGPSNPRAEAIGGRYADERTAVVPATDAMAPLMAWADLAVAAAGSTVYELCCLGVPTLVVAIAETQIACAEGLLEAGLVVDLGWHAAMDAPAAAAAIEALRHDHARRAGMVRRAQRLVDGRGASRVAAVLLDAAGRGR